MENLRLPAQRKEARERLDVGARLAQLAFQLDDAIRERDEAKAAFANLFAECVQRREERDKARALVRELLRIADRNVDPFDAMGVLDLVDAQPWAREGQG
jgi:hypothetical protein